MKEEIWKAVDGYEGLYEVSSYGNVRSVDRIVTYSDGRKRLWKGSILKAEKNEDGYLRIPLSKSNERKKYSIHRLVAQAFIPNPNNLPQVNHKDENKTNNFVFLKKDDTVDLGKSNLEWCDGKYNKNYGTRNKRIAEKQLNSPKFSIPVLQIDVNTGRVISDYQSTMEAERRLNIFHCNISACCKGKRKTAGGYKWRYKE